MIEETTYPYTYIKVYEGIADELHYVTFTQPGISGHMLVNQVGRDLVDFCVLDLVQYRELLGRYFANGQIIESAVYAHSYQEMRNLIFDIADLLQSGPKVLYFFIVGALNNIFASEILSHMQFVVCLSVLDEVLRLHKTFESGLHWCFDADNLRKYSQGEWFLGFLAEYPQYERYALQTNIGIAPAYKGKYDFESIQRINDMNLPDARSQLKEIHRYHKKGVSIVRYISIDSLEEMLYFEFTEMLRRGVWVKRCQLCGRYFLLPNQHAAHYCSRIYQGGRTCKQIGGKLAYQERQKGDAYLREYERIYKERYKRGEVGGEEMVREMGR